MTNFKLNEPKRFITKIKKTRIENYTTLQEVLKMVDENSTRVYFLAEKEVVENYYGDRSETITVFYLVQKSECPNENYEDEMELYELRKKQYERRMKKIQNDQ